MTKRSLQSRAFFVASLSATLAWGQWGLAQETVNQVTPGAGNQSNISGLGGVSSAAAGPGTGTSVGSTAYSRPGSGLAGNTVRPPMYYDETGNARLEAFATRNQLEPYYGVNTTPATGAEAAAAASATATPANSSVPPAQYPTQNRYGYLNATADQPFFYDYYSYNPYYYTGNTYGTFPTAVPTASGPMARYFYYQDSNNDGFFDQFYSSQDADNDGINDRYELAAYQNAMQQRAATARAAEELQEKQQKRQAARELGEIRVTGGLSEAAQAEVNAEISGELASQPTPGAAANTPAVAPAANNNANASTASNASAAASAAPPATPPQPSRDLKQMQLTGTVAASKSATVNGNQHTVLQIRSDGGQTMVVDAGPASALSPNALTPGTEIVINGLVQEVGQSDVLFADRIDVDGKTMMVDRRGAVMEGTIIDIERIPAAGGEHTIVIANIDGQRQLIDLGRATAEDLGLVKSEPISFRGVRAKIGDYPVMLAVEASTGGDPIQIVR